MCVFSSAVRTARVMLFFVSVAIVVANGCSRDKYRLEADRDAYEVIAERNIDPRWCAKNYSIEIDPRSRYYDRYDPDHSPMPLDDPSSHQYMHVVDGIKGWEHWDRNGARVDLENPAWQEALGKYVELTEDLGWLQFDGQVGCLFGGPY